MIRFRHLRPDGEGRRTKQLSRYGEDLGLVHQFKRSRYGPLWIGVVVTRAIRLHLPSFDPPLGIDLVNRQLRPVQGITACMS